MYVLEDDGFPHIPYTMQTKQKKNRENFLQCVIEIVTLENTLRMNGSNFYGLYLFVGIVFFICF